ncbi:hypothetical protein CYY_007495, partial [Polysphondylium violaceum]
MLPEQIKEGQNAFRP